MLEMLPPLLPGMNILVGSSTGLDRLVGHATYPIFATGPHGVRYTHALKVATPTHAAEAQVDNNVVALTELDYRLRRWKEQNVPVLIRDYVDPLSQSERQLLSDVARAFEGRKYDYLQCVVYGITGRFILDGPKRVVCSRLCTAVDEIALEWEKCYATAGQLATYERYKDIWLSPWGYARA